MMFMKAQCIEKYAIRNEMEAFSRREGSGLGAKYAPTSSRTSVAGVQLLSCLTLRDPMDYSMLASSVVYYLPEFAQIHVHWVSDAIQPACPLSSPSPPAFPASGSFLMSISLHQVAKVCWASASASVLQVNIQDWFPLGLTGFISLLSRVFSRTTVRKHQFIGTHPTLWSSSHICMRLLEKP